MKARSTISVAMATYNGGLYLQDQLESLAEQDLSPLELVVTDDGSQDDTVSLIKGFAQHAPFPVRFEQNTERLGYGRNFLKAASSSSPNFGKWVGVELTSENKRQLWIPPGFAHGFVVTSESAEFLYKTTDYWFPEHERSLLWNDPAVGIERPLDGEPKLAAKDAAAKVLGEAEVFA